DGVARHAQVSGQRARGWHPGRRADAAGADLGLQRPVDATIERPRVLPQIQEHGPSLGPRSIWPLRFVEIWLFLSTSVGPRIAGLERRRKEEMRMTSRDDQATLEALNRGYLLAAEKSDV